MFPEVSWLQNFCTFSQRRCLQREVLYQLSTKADSWLGWLDLNQRSSRNSCRSQSPVPYQLGDTPVFKRQGSPKLCLQHFYPICAVPPCNSAFASNHYPKALQRHSHHPILKNCSIQINVFGKTFISLTQILFNKSFEINTELLVVLVDYIVDVILFDHTIVGNQTCEDLYIVEIPRHACWIFYSYQNITLA